MLEASRTLAGWRRDPRMENEPRDHDLGLANDLPRLMDRRRVLQLLGGIGVVSLAGCDSGSDDATVNSTSAASSSTSGASSTIATTAGATAPTAAADCVDIPEETAGPYPGDRSNGPDVLSENGIVRRDITRSFGSASTVAEGVPLTINLTVLDTANGCRARKGAAVYVWHCDRDGQYSLYSTGVEDENYLRGVQETNADGRVTFTSVFPGAYAGRWPHIHFEIYPSIDEATGAGTKLRTSQMALPEATCKAVYEAAGYEQSVQNLSQISLAQDNVFSDDGGVHQLPTSTGDADRGYTVELDVPV